MNIAGVIGTVFCYAGIFCDKPASILRALNMQSEDLHYGAGLVVMICAMVALFPMSLYDGLDEMKFFSLFGTTAICTLMVYSCVLYGCRGTNMTLGKEPNSPWWVGVFQGGWLPPNKFQMDENQQIIGMEFPTTMQSFYHMSQLVGLLGALCFAGFVQPSTPFVYRDLNDKSKGHMLNFYWMIFCGLAMATVGICGFLSYGYLNYSIGEAKKDLWKATWQGQPIPPQALQDFENDQYGENNFASNDLIDWILILDVNRQNFLTHYLGIAVAVMFLMQIFFSVPMNVIPGRFSVLSIIKGLNSSQATSDEWEDENSSMSTEALLKKNTKKMNKLDEEAGDLLDDEDEEEEESFEYIPDDDEDGERESFFAFDKHLFITLSFVVVTAIWLTMKKSIKSLSKVDDFVLEFTGAVPTPFLAFLYPGFFFIKAVPSKKRTSFDTIAAWILMIVTPFIFFLGCWGAGFTLCNTTLQGYGVGEPDFWSRQEML